MIETRHLYYFLAVAREQNITRAAETLHLTQPTLSKQLMELETQLGKQLFIRGKRKMILTEDGAFFRSKAQEITDLMEKTEAAFLSNENTVRGDIYFGCAETYAMEYITEIMAEIKEKYPDIIFHIHSGDAGTVLEKLDKGLVDIGLQLGGTRFDKYNYTELPIKEGFGILMPENAPLAQKDKIGIDDVIKFPLIIPEQTFFDHYEENFFDGNFSKINVAATYNLIYNAIFMVKKGIGYAICLDKLIEPCYGTGLVFKPIITSFTADICIVTKKYQTFSPAVKVFIEYLNQYKYKSE